MMHGQNIICFAKDWTEDPTSNNHVMKGLARNNKVLWLNSIGMRTPNLANKGDVQKILRKLKSFSQGPVEVEPNLWVYTPIVLPFPHSPWATRVNREILRGTLKALRYKLGMNEFQLWTFLPNAVRHVGRLGESSVVYYCTDEFSQFSYLDGARLAEMERELCGKADVVFTTARSLWEAKRGMNPETHLALHGVDQAHFAKALAPATEVPSELRDVKTPILGFFGLIHDWIDQDLLAFVAQKRPDWTLAIIGKAQVDTSRLQRLPNVRLLGRKAYEELPAYCKAFSLGLLPFAINELTRNVNPIKLREYLSAGLPVVSTDLPEVHTFSRWAAIAHTKEEFLAACETALSTDAAALREERSRAMTEETWDAKVAEVGRIVMDALARRPAAGAAA